MNVTVPVHELDPELVPNLDELVTQDGAPVDRIFTEKQQRLLVEPLYSSWSGPDEGRPFLALANVGVFHTVKRPALVPDALLSVDVSIPDDLHVREGHSYYLWLMGKPPDVVIEIISDRRGEEESEKQRAYARLRVPFYVIFDPENILGAGELRVLELRRTRYARIDSREFPEVGLGLTLWQGPFEGHTDTWLRWCDPRGQVIPTGAERANREEKRANRLAAQLRALGIQPEA